MIAIRPGKERGRTRLDWLDSWHSFSFGGYYDPEHTGFGRLRVINEDIVQPGSGFPAHPHADMEIITYMLEGELEHKDSMGNGSVIRAGEAQYMSAGTGVRHSEFNPSAAAPCHLFQIWIQPERKGLVPRYDQRKFDRDGPRGAPYPVVSRDGRSGSIASFQDFELWAVLLNPGQRAEHRIKTGRSVWLQVARGEVSLAGAALKTGDGAAVRDESAIGLTAAAESEILLFDLS